MINKNEFQNSFNLPLIILGILLSFLVIHSQIIERLITRWLNRRTAKEQDLIDRRIALKREQAPVSKVDQFAKYSKLQRQINAIDEELKDINGNKTGSNYVNRLGLNYGLKISIGVLLITFLAYYRYSPVVKLNDTMDLWPFTKFVCYPNDDNFVSFHFWILCCSAVMRLIKI